MEFLEISEEAFRKSLTENLKPSSGSFIVISHKKNFFKHNQIFGVTRVPNTSVMFLFLPGVLTRLLHYIAESLLRSWFMAIDGKAFSYKKLRKP